MNAGNLIIWVGVALLVIIAIRVLFGKRGTRAITRNTLGVVDRIRKEIDAIGRDITHGTFDRNVDRRINILTTLINQIADEDVSLGMVLDSIREELGKLQKELEKQVGYQKVYAQARERGHPLDELDETYAEVAESRVKGLSQEIVAFKSLEDYVAKLQKVLRVATARNKAKEHSAAIEGSALKGLHAAAENINDILDEHVDINFENPLGNLRKIAEESAQKATIRLADAIGAPQEKEEKDPVALRAHELQEAMQPA